MSGERFSAITGQREDVEPEASSSMHRTAKICSTIRFGRGSIEITMGFSSDPDSSSAATAVGDVVRVAGDDDPGKTGHAAR